MYRVRLQLPEKEVAQYRHLDLIHDALVQAWLTAGAASEEVVGMDALPWTFAVLGYHRKHQGFAHSVVVSTPSEKLTKCLQQFDPQSVRYARAQYGELLDFSNASILPEPDPILPGIQMLGMVCLSPIAVSRPGSRPKRWETDISQVDLSAVANKRLSRIAGRSVTLKVQPDSLFVMANPQHSVLVQDKLRPKGKGGYVLGMEAPIVAAGSEADLRLLWYAGIGEKTRNGFGCLGLLDEGVGR